MRCADLRNEPMCETSEKGERLFSREEMLPMSLDIGRRIVEVFGFQPISNIVFRLKSTSRIINSIINGGDMPSAEILLGTQKITGASIDWLLTGRGPKYLFPHSGVEGGVQIQTSPPFTIQSDRERVSPLVNWVFTQP